jgi:hypothetical protein
MPAVTVRTGQSIAVPGIYRSTNCAHNIERTFPKGHTAPPCEHCKQAVVWVLVRETQTK